MNKNKKDMKSRDKSAVHPAGSNKDMLKNPGTGHKAEDDEHNTVKPGAKKSRKLI